MCISSICVELEPAKDRANVELDQRRDSARLVLEIWHNTLSLSLSINQSIQYVYLQEGELPRGEKTHNSYTIVKS